jgi:NikR C terminal nickel binding domain
MEVTALKGSSGDLQHFADPIFAECGVRYGRVAMIPASAKTKRHPKAYLTIETPVVACPFRVDSVEKSMPLPTKVPSNLH